MLDRHLRCLVVDHEVEETGLEREDAAGHVRVHQPDRAHTHQAEIRALIEDLAQALDARATQACDVFPGGLAPR